MWLDTEDLGESFPKNQQGESFRWGEVDTKVDLVYTLNVKTTGLVNKLAVNFEGRKPGKDSILVSGPMSGC